MKYGRLILEKKDFVTLKKLLIFYRYYEDYSHKDALERLSEKIGMAMVEDEMDMPDDVVRLNSQVTVESTYGARKTFQLAPSIQGDINKKTVSVVSMVGANLVGHAVDDHIQFGFPSDVQSFRIVDVAKNHRLSSSFEV